MGTAITTSAEEIITPHWLPGELRWIGPSDTGYDLNNIFLNDPDLEYKCKNPTGATEVVENAIDDYKLIYPNKETIGSHSKWIECLQSKLELDEAQVYNFGNDLACLAKSTYLHRVAMTIGSELNLLENISSEELRQEFENGLAEFFRRIPDRAEGYTTFKQLTDFEGNRADIERNSGRVSMSNYVKNYIASITNEDPSLQTSKILSKIDGVPDMAESLYRLIAGFLCKKSPEGRETFLSRVRFSAQVSNALSTATEVMKKRNRD